MGSEPSDPSIEQLLAELRSEDAARRKAALARVIDRQVQDAEVIKLIQILAQSDSDAMVRYWAQQALMVVGAAELTLVPSAPGAPGSPTRQFWAGFFLWLLINVPLMVIAGFANVFYSRNSVGVLAMLLNFLPLIANIGIIIWLAFTPRRYLAFGALTALASILVLLLLFGPFAVAACFSWPLVRG